MQKIFLWSAGINGEGSSIVTSQFILNLLSSSSKTENIIFITKNTTLYDLIFRDQGLIASDLTSNPHIQFVCLPSLFRNYIIQFLFKLLFPIGFFCSRVVVFDDYPFLWSKSQVLYFHQSNLIFNSNFVWSIKRIAFKLLLQSQPIVYFQTRHTYHAFVSHIASVKSLIFTHEIN